MPRDFPLGQTVSQEIPQDLGIGAPVNMVAEIVLGDLPAAQLAGIFPPCPLVLRRIEKQRAVKIKNHAFYLFHHHSSVFCVAFLSCPVAAARFFSESRFVASASAAGCSASG